MPSVVEDESSFLEGTEGLFESDICKYTLEARLGHSCVQDNA